MSLLLLGTRHPGGSKQGIKRRAGSGSPLSAPKIFNQLRLGEWSVGLTVLGPCWCLEHDIHERVVADQSLLNAYPQQVSLAAHPSLLRSNCYVVCFLTPAQIPACMCRCQVIRVAAGDVLCSLIPYPTISSTPPVDRSHALNRSSQVACLLGADVATSSQWGAGPSAGAGRSMGNRPTGNVSLSSQRPGARGFQVPGKVVPAVVGR